MFKVLKNFKGSPDGCAVLDYAKDDELHICSTFSEDLAQVALAEGWVKEVAGSKPKAAPAKKAAVKKAK